MRTIQWTDRMTTLLIELYPVETTSHTAMALGISETLVKQKARKLGLVKVAKTKWMERADYIRRHFHYKSFTQMARDLGISRSNVCNIAVKLGLKRSRTETSCIISQTRIELVKRERRHVIFGLEPLTQLKVVSNRARVRIRSRLKSLGYVVYDERVLLYATDNFERKTKLESKAVKLGLSFLPITGNNRHVVFTL